MSARLSGARSTYLDALRACAAQIVVIGHAWSLSGRDQTLEVQAFGVEVFLILSGFLICLTAMDRRDQGYGFREFCEDRFFRIFVPFVPALLLVVALDAVTYRLVPNPAPEASDLRTFLANLFMLQEHPAPNAIAKWFGMAALDISSFGSARQFWTIALEWWWYLAFGYVLLAKRVSLIVVAVLGVVPLVSLVRGGAGDPVGWLWLGGAALGWAWFRFRPDWSSPLFALAGCAFAALAALRIVLLDRDVFQFYDLAVSAFAGVALACFFICAPRWLEAAALVIRPFAASSYSLYLTHLPLIALAYAADPEFPILLAVVPSNVAAFGYWWLVERHHGAVKLWWRCWLSTPRLDARSDVSDR